MKTIYTRNCYTYLIGWKNLNVFYYGRKTADKCKPENFWKTYFTSSRYVKEFREIHGEPDIIQIRKIFGEDVVSCRKWECRVLKKLNAKDNNQFLNKSNSDKTFDSTGKACARITLTGESIGVTLLDDPRWASGEIESVAIGKININIRNTLTAKNVVTGKKLGIRISKDDPRLKTGELVSTSKGSVTVKSHNGIQLGRVPIDDPRLKTGEIVVSCTGNNKNKVAGRFITSGEYIQVDLNDHRFLTGELVMLHAGLPNPSAKGVHAAIEVSTKRSLGRVLLSDPRWKTGEIISVSKGVRKGKTTAFLAEDGTYIGLINSDDIRWAKKLIIGPRKRFLLFGKNLRS